MKRILIIANLLYAPLRMRGAATYLAEFGWEATIITPTVGSSVRIHLEFPKKYLERAKIIEAPYRGDVFWFWRKIFKRFGFKIDESITEQIKERVGITSRRSPIDILMKWYQTIFAYPDTERTWRAPALRAASEILKKERFDAILSSSPFPTSHIVAAELKRRFGLPWLADFRDLWTQNHNYSYVPIRRRLEEQLELRTLDSVDAVTTVSAGLAEKQEHFHKKPVAVVTNGFDPENVNDPPADLTDKFTITYTGTIYTGKQDPKKLLEALGKLVSKGAIEPDDIEVRFYGSRQNWLKDTIIKQQLADIVKQCGVVSRIESWQKQRESHVLLLLNWEDPEERGVYSLKLFEYLAARRPILASGGFSGVDIEKLLIQTEAGVYAPTVEEIETSLLGFYNEYQYTGRVCYKGDLREINKYSYREMASKFGDILNQATEK